MKLSVIIPAYNEADNIQLTIKELLGILNKIDEINEFKIIVIDDHSLDNTYETVCHISNDKITCLRLSKRSGSHIAIRVGMKEAKGDAVLCISADGQDDPKCLPEMIKKWKEDTKIVWALRKNRKNESWWYRNLAKVFYRILSWVKGDKNSVVDQSRADFFLLDRVVVDALDSYSERNTNLFGLLNWIGFTQDFVEYDRRMRRHGRSKWNFRKRICMAKEWIIAFSRFPLKLISIIGIIVTILALIYSMYKIISFISGNSLDILSLILLAILLLGGIQMIMFGIIGEYIWHNLEETRKRPLYFIEKRSDLNKDVKKNNQ